MSNMRTVIFHTACRFISSSSLSYKNYVARESKFLFKLISKSEPKRKWYKHRPNFSPENDIAIQKKKLTSLYVQRRLTTLNKLFMKNITDLMSTSNVSNMSEHQIEVTHVNLSPDFQIANVYWTHENINNKKWLATTEEMLKNYAFILRHELTQLRVISHVPPIQFVKNKTCSLIKEVEERLATADLGEDYKHSTLTLKETFQICQSSKIDNITLKSDIVNNDEIFKSDDIDIVLPQMRHDVLGLDHHSIMSKIKNSLNQSVSKSKNNTIYPTSTSSNMDIFMHKEQRELFTQFLKIRQIKEKQRRRLKNSRELKQNPVYTDVQTLEDEEDLETSFDDTFEYSENTYENEINDYD